MKKKLSYGLVGLGIAVGAIGFSFVGSFDSEQVEAKEEIVTQSNKQATNTLSSPQLYSISQAEFEQAKQTIGQVQDETTLISRMVEMSLQKVNFGGEKFTPMAVNPNTIQRIPMIEANIAYLKQCLSAIQVEKNTEQTTYTYENILNRWLEGDFSQIIDENKHLLSLLTDGTYTGQTITSKTEVEEQEYVSKFFSER